MERKEANNKSVHPDKLSTEARRHYLEKISLVNALDPYEILKTASLTGVVPFLRHAVGFLGSISVGVHIHSSI